MTALILEAHIACINSDNNFGRSLSQSLKLNFDIDAKFPDRDSKKIFSLYFDPPTTKHDISTTICTDFARTQTTHLSATTTLDNPP